MAEKLLKVCKAYLLDILFPNRCPLCGGFIAWNESICEICRGELEHANDKICHKCGQTLCERRQGVHLDGVYSAMFFDDENVSRAIYDFKRYGTSNIAEYAANECLRFMPEDKYDMVVAVPMGKKKLRKRGHNQAEILAECIGEHLDIPSVRNVLYKKDTDEEQHFLSSEERRNHVKTLFYTGDTDLTGKSVILCDDVMTTGSTVNACAALLKKLGAVRVTVIVCAVTRLNNKSREKG